MSQTSTKPKRFAQFLIDSRLLREALWRYRGRFSLGVFILFIVDLLELMPPLILAWAIDRVVSAAPMSDIYWLGALYLGVSALQAACRVGWRYFINRSSMMAGRDLRQGIMDHVLSLGSSYFDRSRIGDLLSLVTNDTEAVRMAIGPGVLTLFDALFYFLTVPFAMWALSPRLTILSCLPLLLVPLFVFRNETKIRNRFESVQASFSAISAFSQETLTGARVLKGLAVENGRWDQFEEKGFEFIHLNMRLARVQSSFGPGLDFFMSLALVALLWAGGNEVIGGAVSIGTFVAFQRYIQKMVWPMTAVGLAVTYFQRAFASSQRIDEELAERTDVPQAQEALSPKMVGRLEFKNLSFQFESEATPVLNNISLVILPGERVAFSGRVGSGKSTLLSLLPRLYAVAPKQIEIDGVDVTQWDLEVLRSSIGYVSQDLFLFNASLMDNLRVAEGNPTDGRVFSPEQVQAACRLAQIHDEILDFEMGYETLVGERGVTVSGGQKQRLTLARALLTQPKILILDDALSAVDVNTERKILEGISRIENPPVILMAAHRVQTLQVFDRVVFLEKGEITHILPGKQVTEV